MALRVFFLRTPEVGIGLGVHLGPPRLIGLFIGTTSSFKNAQRRAARYPCATLLNCGTTRLSPELETLKRKANKQKNK